MTCAPLLLERRSRVGFNDFSDAALVLVGHGTTLNAGSSAPAKQHAAELRRRQIFAAVHEAFWKQEPNLAEVSRSLAFRRLFFVPLFVSEGYFSSEIIPKALGFETTTHAEGALVQHRENQTRFYCRPVGTHSSMT
ncbi:MAG TPA: CbiX/SirB N-terminal domain-containing protein, partial [Verrucomicrobiae bacterium]|nr:CbiX/SirB N-terminal domain-containing protein [Verrucomicrobiae bacterium]